MSTRIVEELAVFAPLGLRFWDPVLDRVIDDGLQVRAWEAQARGRPVHAHRTRSGLYAFRWLPGMRPIEHRYPDPTFFDASLPQRRRFVVAVSDDRERFLPVAFEVALPLPYRGVFLTGAGGSPPDAAPPGVHLFSAPTRRATERLTAVRGTLLDADLDRPASWAVLRLSVPHGRSWYGVADQEGRFLVLLPTPSLEEGFAGSPGSFGDGVPLGERGWDVSVSVLYEPGRLTALPGTSSPEYRSILDQRPGSLWSQAPDAGGTAEPERGLRLAYGQELIMRTDGRSVQLVSGAPASP